MKCPNCGSHLAERKIRSFPVHCCMGCDGVWASREVFVYLGNILSWDLQPPKGRMATLFRPIKVGRATPSRHARICPQCAVSMKQFNYAYDSNIFLDRCPDCGGIWADAGEMLQVARHLKPDLDREIIAKGLIVNPYLEQMDREADTLAQVLEIVLQVMRILFLL